jgi:hypothetical protein
MIPSGFDLFKHDGYPLRQFEVDPKTHPLYAEFIRKSREHGFVTESGGFQDSEYGYFEFFLMGHESAKK